MPVLDSSFLVDYLHEEGYTLEYLEGDRHATYQVPTLVRYELYAGAARSDASGESIPDVASALEWAETVGFSEGAARTAARIDADLLEQGQRINAADVLIAGIARASNMTLVATDAHFERVLGLELHNPRPDDYD